MGATGLELARVPAGNASVGGSGGIKSGNKPAPDDPELAAVVAAWGDLSEPTRAAVVALVAAGKPTTR